MDEKTDLMSPLMVTYEGGKQKIKQQLQRQEWPWNIGRREKRSFHLRHSDWMGCLGSSAGKESACNAGDPSSVPGSGNCPGERTGCPLQYSWSSLVVQMVKNLPVMWEACVWSLGWEDPLDDGNGNPLQFSCLENSMDRGAWQATVHGVTKSRTQLSD